MDNEEFARSPAGLDTLLPDILELAVLDLGDDGRYHRVGAAPPWLQKFIPNAGPGIEIAVETSFVSMRKFLQRCREFWVRKKPDRLASGAWAQTDAAGRTWLLQIEDSGIGNTPEAQERLFRPFVQAEADTTRRFGGTGLGLVTSRRLAELMGGTLSLASAKGQCTTTSLQVEWPVARAGDLESVWDFAGSREAFGALKQEPVPAYDGSVRVLVAEDNAVNHAVMRSQLAALGMQADFADNGEQALDMWRAGHHALVLCDCQMPVMDGYTFTRKLRACEARDPGRKRIPVIAWTANVMRGDEQACYAAGMDDVLSKPVSLAALRQMLTNWLPGDAAAGAPIERDDTPEALGETPMDRERFRQIVNGDLVLERELLLMTPASDRDDSNRLQVAIRDKDWEQGVRQAYLMKVTALNIAADALAAVCERIEKGGGRSRWRGCNASQIRS